MFWKVVDIWRCSRAFAGRSGIAGEARDVGDCGCSGGEVLSGW